MLTEIYKAVSSWFYLARVHSYFVKWAKLPIYKECWLGMGQQTMLLSKLANLRTPKFLSKLANLRTPKFGLYNRLNIDIVVLLCPSVLFRTKCHNSLIFWATDSRFCMEVRMNCLQGSMQKNNFRDSLKKILKLGKIKEMAITRPFFELHTPDFAWKFIWTVWTNYEKKL